VIGKHLLAQKVDTWWIPTITVEYETARGAVEKDGRGKGYSICSTKTVPVPVQRAFAAFSDKADLDRWFGPATKIAFDVDGAISNADGNKGRFTKITADKTIRFTWEDASVGAGSAVEVLFQPKDGKTGLVINHTRIQSRADADAIRAGWESALNALKGLLS
jgi:uncharacterized protein YndB with AHSA1/START domain